MRVPATGVVEAEEEEALLEAELMPEVSGDDWEADSQNCGEEGLVSKSPQPGRLRARFRSPGVPAPSRLWVCRGAGKEGLQRAAGEERSPSFPGRRGTRGRSSRWPPPRRSWRSLPSAR